MTSAWKQIDQWLIIIRFCFSIYYLGNLLIIGGNIDLNTMVKTEIINYYNEDLYCTPIDDAIIFDTYLEGATGDVINDIPIICNGYSKSGKTDKCWNIQTKKEIVTTNDQKGYAASIVLNQNGRQKVIFGIICLQNIFIYI